MSTQERTVTCSRGVAGQVAYAVTTQTDTGPFTVTYVGSIYGTPGPVTMIWGDLGEIHFGEPERFGATFGRAWIDAVLADADRFTALLEDI